MQSVFGLSEDSVSMGFKGGFADFLAAVGGKAVHDKGFFVSSGDEVFIDLVASKVSLALGCFFLHTHRDPHVSVQ